MGVDYTIEGKMLTVSAQGPYTMAEIYLTFARAMADPALDAPVNVLLDARNTDYGPPTAEIEAFAEHIGALKTYFGGRWAIVARPDTLLFAISRMLCCFAEDQGLVMEAFKTLDDAAMWLLELETA